MVITISIMALVGMVALIVLVIGIIRKEEPEEPMKKVVRISAKEFEADSKRYLAGQKKLLAATKLSSKTKKVRSTIRKSVFKTTLAIMMIVYVAIIPLFSQNQVVNLICLQGIIMLMTYIIFSVFRNIIIKSKERKNDIWGKLQKHNYVWAPLMILLLLASSLPILKNLGW